MRTRPIPPVALINQVASQAAGPVPAVLMPLVERMGERFGPALAAVLFYGSCLRNGDPTDGVADLYVVVDSYHGAYDRPLLRCLNACLPPNVFYLEHRAGATVLRAKYAVLSLADLERGTGGWFHSYLWGRFAQPVRLVHARDAAVRDRVHRALAAAVVTLLRRALPCLPDEFDADECWQRALALSYAAELRPESGRARELVAGARDHYRRLLAAAQPAVPGLIPAAQAGRFRSSLSKRARHMTRLEWWLRRVQGRVLSVLRLMKSAFTFENGVDYAAWKLERHTGARIEVTPRLRRHPLIFGWGVLWRLLRGGHLR